MGTYRKEWDCCGSVTETEAWEPESCPFCTDSTQPTVAAQQGSIGEDARFNELVWDIAKVDEHRWMRDRIAELVAYIDSRASSAPADPIAPDGWLPIETAPKDGTLILLGRAADESNDSGEISTPGRWHEDDADGPDNMGHDAGFMDDEFQQFAWGRSFGNSAYKNGGYQPTHWMPLPPAPQQEGSEAGNG